MIVLRTVALDWHVAHLGSRAQHRAAVSHARFGQSLDVLILATK
jgi:hypothetical protein